MLRLRGARSQIGGENLFETADSSTVQNGRTAKNNTAIVALPHLEEETISPIEITREAAAENRARGVREKAFIRVSIYVGAHSKKATNATAGVSTSARCRIFDSRAKMAIGRAARGICLADATRQGDAAKAEKIAIL